MSDIEPETETAALAEKPPTYFGKGLLWGLASGWVFIFLPYFIVIAVQEKGLSFLFDGDVSWVYNGSILLLMPILQGFVAGLMRGPAKHGSVSAGRMVIAIWAIDTLMAMVFLREGIICLVMAIPLLWPMILIGYAIGREIARWRMSKTVSVSLAPLAVLAVVGETQGPPPNYADAISDTITVNAPPEYVWRYVVDYPENPNPPDYWLWQMGLPMPTHSVAPVQKVGQRRDCKFTGDQAFVERIAELEPNKKLTFLITEQPHHPEIIGHLTVDKGQVVLERNADGTTTMIATSWYRLHVRPAAYFDWWAADITRHVHFRVMGYMKTLAERDYQADLAKKQRKSI